MRVKLGRIRVAVYSPVSVFLISVSLSLFVLWTERLVGIGWDFHPDANTYITLSAGAKDNFTFKNAMGASFYVLVDYLKSNVNFVITLNVIIYSFTNVALANFFVKKSRTKSLVTFILFFLVIFNPYRIHLSVHVLKDTLVIFGLVWFLTCNKRYSWLFLIFSYMFSLRVIMYLVALIRMRNVIILMISIIIFILMLPPEFLFSVLSTENQVNMTFRSFDSVPNYFEFGFIGAIIRAIVWPFLYLTGFFIFLSPSILYFPVALGSFLLQIWHIKQFGKLALTFQIYLGMSVLAFMVSGFTSFVRYALPLLTILPLVIMENKWVRYAK